MRYLQFTRVLWLVRLTLRQASLVECGCTADKLSSSIYPVFGSGLHPFLLVPLSSLPQCESYGRSMAGGQCLLPRVDAERLSQMCHE